MYKYEYKCPKCKRIYKSNQEPQQILICDCGKVDIPLYSINLRYCYPTLIETLMNEKPNKKLPRYKWVTKDDKELYIDEMTKQHKQNILKLLERNRHANSND